MDKDLNILEMIINYDSQALANKCDTFIKDHNLDFNEIIININLDEQIININLTNIK